MGGRGIEVGTVAGDKSYDGDNHYYLGRKEMNLPTASCGVSAARILAPSSLKFALQRLKTLLATIPHDSSR